VYKKINKIYSIAIIFFDRNKIYFINSC